jgi:hypothetical protein
VPKYRSMRKMWSDPYKHNSPSTLWRIRKGEKGYEVKKMLEDREAKTLAGVTAIRHDVKTGRLFMSSKYNGKKLVYNADLTGVVAPFMMVCEPKQ